MQWGDFALVLARNFLLDPSSRPLHHTLPNLVLKPDYRIPHFTDEKTEGRYHGFTASGVKRPSQLMSFYHQSWRSSSSSERPSVCGRNSKMAKRGPGMMERRDTPQRPHLHVESKKTWMNTSVPLQNRDGLTGRADSWWSWGRGVGKGGGGFGLSRCKPLHIERRSNKALLDGTGSHGQYLVINHNGEEHGRRIHICVKLDHWAVQQKLTQRCKSAILQ